MDGGDSTYSLAELCQLSGVTRRTVRYYIKQGLLPSAARRGRGARYAQAHLSRLRLILRLKGRDIPLARIRERLADLSDADVRKLVEAPRAAEPDSAADYIRTLLEKQGSRHAGPTPRPSPSPGSGAPSGDYERSQWDRIRVHPDVEIHVRRPLSRSQHQQVRRLVDLALRLAT